MKKYLLTLMLLLICAPAFAETTYRASVSVGEEYNDNVNQSHNPTGDFVTVVKPSVGFRYQGPKLLFESDYSGTYNWYAKATRDTEAIHNFGGHGLLDVWNEFFYLDAADKYQNVYRDSTRGNVVEGDQSTTVNQVAQNTFTLSPYIQPRFGDRTTAMVGYRYTDIAYDSSSSVDKQSHTGFTDWTYEMSQLTSLLAGYSYTEEQAGSGGSNGYQRQMGYVGAQYQYTEDGMIYAKVGPSSTHYDQTGETKTTPFWDAGITQGFGSVTVSLTSSLSYTDDPNSNDSYQHISNKLTISKEFERTTVSVFGGLDQYESGLNGSTTNRSSVGASISHQLTQRLSANANILYELQDASASNDTNRWYGGAGLRYDMGEGYAAELWYRAKESFTNGSTGDNYTVNRFGLQLSKQF
ncbi:PEP-CTERM system associated protein [Desulfovibrio sp. X2]|uniref:TIGR03016 family PEP-CTERM system-associated outer membrane protein n=1 Tax=Desulfovibrio sp. X2 TaxID=941449 RepID=UPI000358E581|nr:TIGR03016 family PEP-CTERM system-associated outer membrane protein [Desulfovibrio sp. X2]EPR37244.1 PEP-CTERM system associated protein [Desulfovibrio sp. X2]